MQDEFEENGTKGQQTKEALSGIGENSLDQ